ncbi:hypothetical protein GCM10028824_38390 [Hymenobacter segetis]|uniref:Gliding motility-associated C-terminal domain-containing protein n=1 Tax=Hymenobacter segetis TaxID=2025509 RepID=A0ABU9M044_9BACT
MKLLLPLAATLLLGNLTASAQAQPANPPVAATPSLEFIENKGQWDGHARYVAALPSGRLFAEADGLTFALLDASALSHHGATAHHEPANGQPTTPADSVFRGHAVTLRFVGAASTASITPAEATADRRNYFLGTDPKHWAQDVRGYHRLRYAGMWPGVDAQVYESADQQLEYDFELAAGADPTTIVLRHDGAEKAQLDANGNLLLQTSVGRIMERAPQAWQADAAGQHRPVACRYRLAADGTVRFALGTYDRQLPLTIDPVVVFSTYTGSFADNWGFTSTYDAQGNLYSGGIVFGVGYPASPGAFRTTFAGITDIAIIKYNTAVSGTAARVWATYLGGSNADFPTSMVVNSQGELLMLGATSSTDFPTTTGAIQRTFAGGTYTDPYGGGGNTSLPNGTDLVITRFNATGAALVGSTYLGGSGNDGVLSFAWSPSAGQLVNNYGDSFRGDIVVDAADNVYVASHTASTGFPVARGLAGGYHGGATDGLVLKLNPTLTALVWGSFLGGSGADAAYSLQVEPVSGDVYVAGGTTSTNFPTTAGSYRPTTPGFVDGFAARISTNGLSLSRATYVGTADYDQVHFLQLGSDGGVYLLGQTLGAYPRTPGAFGTTNGTLFVQKLAADLGSSLISTAFGSTDSRNLNHISLSPTAFLVDQCDRVYVCGWGGGANQTIGYSYLVNNGSTFGLPVTAGAIQPTTDGSDFYLAQFTAGLTGLAYGTYYGRTGSTGDHVDGGTARFDPRGVVYQAVCSCTGSGFPIPGGVNTFSPTNNSGNCNNAAFVLNFQPNIANAGTDQTVCATASPLALVGTPAGGVWAGPGVTGSVATGFVFTPSTALLGLQTLTYTVASTGICTTVGSRRITVGIPPTVTFAPVGTGVFCRAVSDPVLARVPLVGTPAGGTFSGPGVANGFFDPMVAGAGTHTLTYTYFNGCTVALTQQVRVAFVSAGGPQRLCTPGPAPALVGTPAGGTWTGPGVTGSAATGFVFTPTAGLAGANTLTYTVATTAPGSAATCTASSSAVYTVVPTPVISLTPVPALCTATLTRQRLTATPAGGYWTGPGVGFDAAGYFFQLPQGLVGTYQYTYTVGDSPCAASAVLSVVVAGLPVVTVAADTVLCPGSTTPFRLRGTPAGGVWSGPGVSGSAATGYQFAPAGLSSFATLTYSVANVGCTGTATRRVSIAPVPDVVPSWAPEICVETRLAPLTVRFRLASTSSVTYTGVIWEFGDGTQSTEINPLHTYATPNSYQPRLRTRYNQGRCETLTTLPVVEVKERKIPNIITPNGDNQNQTFQLGPDCPPHLQVFSRWGQPVFETAAYHDDWNAEGQPDGIYYYLARYPDGHQLKGWVEVRR